VVPVAPRNPIQATNTKGLIGFFDGMEIKTERY
jgi:hypothetical protein